MIDLASGRVLTKGFIGDPSWIDFSHRTVAAVDRERGDAYAANLAARGFNANWFRQQRAGVPAWVPADLRGEYRALAATRGEEEAASIVRCLKRDMAGPA